MSTIDKRLVRLRDDDTVLLLAKSCAAGEAVLIDGDLVTLKTALSLGHKLAARDIAAGETILKFGFPIGVATVAIPRGAHVHVHNMRSDYTPTYIIPEVR